MLVYTLLTDGSSDQVLMPILNWLLVRHGVTTFLGRWGDLRGIRPSPGRLSDRISKVLDLYPCDLLFIHRDAEGMLLETRRAEILDAISEVADFHLPAICVVPVRMQEAWLLLEEPAIRKAAGNPNGRERLSLPRLDDLESLRDPKAVLHGLLHKASGLSRRRHFSPQTSAHRIPELIDDFSPLLRLNAFKSLDAELQANVREHAWHQTSSKV
jgi:hypothetical protein